MVSHDKKLYNNLVQMAMLASLLRFQPDLGGVQEPPPPDADLILGQSWAHTSARTVHAHLEHAAHHKNIDNVIERYQEELFEELHSLGRYQQPFRPSHIQAYQLLDSEAEPPPPPVPEASSNSSVSRLGNDTGTLSRDVIDDNRPPPSLGLYHPQSDHELDLDLELDLELHLERDLSQQLDLDLEAGLRLPPPPAEFDVWEMMDADLAEASVAEHGRASFSTDGADDFIQSDLDMLDERTPSPTRTRQNWTPAADGPSCQLAALFGRAVTSPSTDCSGAIKAANERLPQHTAGCNRHCECLRSFRHL